MSTVAHFYDLRSDCCFYSLYFYTLPLPWLYFELLNYSALNPSEPDADASLYAFIVTNKVFITESSVCTPM